MSCRVREHPALFVLPNVVCQNCWRAVLDHLPFTYPVSLFISFLSYTQHPAPKVCRMKRNMDEAERGRTLSRQDTAAVDVVLRMKLVFELGTPCGCVKTTASVEGYSVCDAKGIQRARLGCAGRRGGSHKVAVSQSEVPTPIAHGLGAITITSLLRLPSLAVIHSHLSFSLDTCSLSVLTCMASVAMQHTRWPASCSNPSAPSNAFDFSALSFWPPFRARDQRSLCSARRREIFEST